MKHLFSIHAKQSSRFTALWLSFIFIALIGMKGWGQAVFTSAATNSWNAAGTWTLNSGVDTDGIPDADDVVTIASGTTVTQSDASACTSLTINTGGTLVVAGTKGKKLTVSGAVTVSGTLILQSQQLEKLNNSSTLTVNSGGRLEYAGGTTNIGTITYGTESTVAYNQAAVQTIANPTSGFFYNLILSGGNTKTFPAEITVTNNLSIASGTTANLGEVFASKANTMTLGGAGVVNGTWGGTGSTANHIISSYFSPAPATGIITIATSTCTAPVITGQPAQVTMCTGTNRSFTLATSAPSPTYQWQYSVDNSTWNITDGITYMSGHNSVTLSINSPVAQSSYYVRCVVSSLGCSANSEPALLIVQGSPTITAHPANQTVCGSSGSAAFTVSANGSEIIYKWQVFTSTTDWTDVPNSGVYSGASTATLTITNPPVDMNGYKYRCILSGPCSTTATSNGLATLNITQPATPAITTQGPTTFCAGGSVTLTSSVGTGYLWSNGATSQSIDVTISGSYTVKLVDANGCESAPSVSVGVTANPLPTVLTATVNPSSVCEPGEVSFSATSSAGATITWYDAATAGKIVTVLNPLISLTTTYYAEAVDNGCSSAVRTAVTATLGSAVSFITQPANQTVCGTIGSAVFTVSATGTENTYKWQVNTTTSTEWADVPNTGVYSGETTATLTISNPPVEMNGYKYQCIVTGVCLDNFPSQDATLTVYGASPAPPTITPPDPTTFCEGGSVTLTSSVGTGNLWSNDVTSPSIVVTTSGSYTVTLVDANGCQSAPSAPVVVTVNPSPAAAGIITGVSSVAPGQTNVSYSVGIIANATSYVWVYSGTGVTINGNGNREITIDYSLTDTGGTLTVHGLNATCEGTNASLSITVVGPVAYAVTGGGSYCTTSINGLPVGLANSETDVEYELYKDGNPIVPVVTMAGTGSSISFGSQPYGIYTVKGTKNSITTNMTGSAVITAVAPPTAYAGATSIATVGVPYLLSAATASSYTSLEWSTNFSGTFNDKFVLQPTFTGFINGTVTLTLTASNITCGSANAKIDLLMLPPGYLKTYTWTGAINTAWEEKGNWSPVPTVAFSIFDDIIIPLTPTYPIINGDASCNNLTIYSGAVLTIGSGGSLTVNATLANNGGNAGLVVKSGGSLIESSTGVAATVERDIPFADTDYNWHYISVPNNTTTANTFLAEYLIKWDETAKVDGWSYIVDPSTPLVPVQGYGLWLASTAKTFKFTGPVNTGPQSKQITFTDQSLAENNNGTNLLGNPYPSSIDWSGLDNTYGAIHYWNGTGYVQWIDGVGDGSQFVRPMQGFFIVTETNSTFTLNNTNRKHGGTTFYKSASDINANSLVLSTVGESYEDKLFVNFNPAATEGFDLQNDAYKFLAYSTGVSELYSFTGEKRLSIDVRPECESIPLGFQNTNSGEYQIGIDQLAGIPLVILEDTKTNTFQDLASGPYKFSYSAGEDEKRFMLHFGTTAVKENIRMDANIYSHQQTVHINMKGQAKGDIFIYNTAGQLISTKVSARGANEISLSNTGIYIVKVISSGSTVVRKVWIQ